MVHPTGDLDSITYAIMFQLKSGMLLFCYQYENNSTYSFSSLFSWSSCSK